MAKNENLINEEIVNPEVRLIGQNGEQLGIVSGEQAQKIAYDAGFDLVMIAPTATPPVCKVMDYNKYKYEQLKKAKEAKKNQKVVEVKEVWLSMTIDIGDINVKAKQTTKFLAAGNKVKVSIKMRGRQNAHSDMGMDVMAKFFSIVENDAIMERKPLLEGRNIIMILAPKK